MSDGRPRSASCRDASFRSPWFETPATRAAARRALASGGLPVAEVTFRTAGCGRGDSRAGAEPELLVGAGTVVRAEQVDVAVEAGARFVVSPGFSGEVVGAALRSTSRCSPGSRPRPR